MKLEKLNQWIGMSANIGVLAGILFLGLEIKQNTDMMRAQTRDSMTEKVLDFRYVLATNRELAELWAGENILGNPKGDADFFMLSSLADASFRIWENEWYQYQQGLFDEEELEGRLTAWEFTLIRSAQYRSYWEIRRGTYSTSFTAQIDAILERISLSNDL